MPENPINTQPLQPQSPKGFDPIAPWLRDLTKDKPVAPKLGVPPVVEEVKKEETPVVPVVEKPVVPIIPVVPAPAATVAPVVTPPSSPLK